MSLTSPDTYLQKTLELFVLTQQTLEAAEIARTASAFTPTVAAFSGQARAILEELRQGDIESDNLCCQLLEQIGDGIAALTERVAINTESGGLLRLIGLELRAMVTGAAMSTDGFSQLAAQVAAITNGDLRDEVTTRATELGLAGSNVAAVVAGFLSYVSHQLRRESFTRRYGTIATLISRSAAFKASRTHRVSRHVVGLWRFLRQALDEPTADWFMAKIGLPLVRWELDRTCERGRPVKVVRAMGGLGDLIMMTPGLRALSRRHGRRIEFAVPARYVELFAENQHVAARPIETLDDSWFTDSRIISLTDCPAGFTESRTAPEVTRNRIELFAEAMGVTKRELDRHGRRPEYEPPPDAKDAARLWLRERGLTPRAFIAVQAISAETYKDWPGMPGLAFHLSQRHAVVVLHDKPLLPYVHAAENAQGLHLAFGLPLSVGLAVLCLAKLIVAPESGLGHIAGARDIPCINIFGPTDGILFARHYPKTVNISRKADLPCIPCWRNQKLPCVLTRTLNSACLATLDEGTVLEAVERTLAITTDGV